MSVTGHSNCRHPSDFYTTPAWATRVLLRRHFRQRIPGVRTVLDTSCGKGAILDVVKEEWPDVTTVGFELDPGRAAIAESKGHEVICCDALAKSPAIWPADLIIQNVPFKLTMPFVERAIKCATVGVISLHSLDFVATRGRGAFWKAHPGDMAVLPKRPSFAMSVKCGQPKGQRCEFAEIREIDAERPRTCPRCGGKVAICTSDSSEYAWFLWMQGYPGGQWWRLEEAI